MQSHQAIAKDANLQSYLILYGVSHYKSYHILIIMSMTKF